MFTSVFPVGLSLLIVAGLLTPAGSQIAAPTPQRVMDLEPMGWEILEVAEDNSRHLRVMDPKGLEREVLLDPLHGRLVILPLRHPSER